MNNEPIAIVNTNCENSIQWYDDNPKKHNGYFLYIKPAELKIETKMQKLEKFNGVYQLGFEDGLKAGMQRAVEMNVVKELTDEEIHVVISNILNTEEFCLEDMPSDNFLIDFARAILRKAQE